MLKRNKQEGFTLIELLVVIAIIGLLSTLSILALNSARARARDAKRISDVRQIQMAVEIYNFENGGYPSESTMKSDISKYLAVFPEVPTPADSPCDVDNNKYQYATTTEGYYTITFCLGSKTGEMGPGVVVASPGGMTTPTP